MTTADIRDDLKRLYGFNSARESKYIRNMNRYNNNGTRREDIWSPYIFPQTFANPSMNSDGFQTNINIIRSGIDTITSKISQARVRPFFNPVNGDLESRIVSRQAQQFFDDYYDTAGIYKESIVAFRDAAIFDTGVMWADELEPMVKRLPPWTYFVDPAEFIAGYITRVMVMRRNYPLSSLRQRAKDAGAKKLLARLDKEPYSMVEFVVYYDLYNGERIEFVDEDEVFRNKINFDFQGGLYRRPFSEIFWSMPVKSYFTTSLCDELYTIQRAIDDQQDRVDAAFRNGLTSLILVPTQPSGRGMKASQITNAPATAMDYEPGPDGSGPVVITPQAIHQQFIDYQTLLESKAYNLTGISQLSAQSKKPSGLDSGVALQTFEDIESERHNVITQNYVHLLVDVAKMMIGCFADNAPILPGQMGREKVTWGSLKQQAKKYTIQFTAGSALSKDPAVKLDQVQKLVAAGMIEPEMAANYLDLPDLQGAYNAMTAAYDYVQKIVEDAAREGKLDYLPVIPLQMLRKHTVVTIARLKEANESDKIINNLLELLGKVTSEIEIMDGGGNMAPPPPAMPAPGPMPGPLPMNNPPLAV